MTRAIKFRAWDKEQQKMIAVPQLHFGDDGSALTITVELKTTEGYYRGLVAGENCELMQFTGLKDRNGKEIYEADILATENDNAEFDRWAKQDFGLTVVVWSEDADAWVGSNWTWEKMNDRESTYDIGFCEVIGNIHENPELVKGE